MWRNDIKYKYMFMFPRKGLTQCLLCLGFRSPQINCDSCLRCVFSVKFVLLPSGQVATLRCHLGQKLVDLKQHFANELKMSMDSLLFMFDGKPLFSLQLHHIASLLALSSLLSYCMLTLTNSRWMLSLFSWFFQSFFFFFLNILCE